VIKYNALHTFTHVLLFSFARGHICEYNKHVLCAKMHVNLPATSRKTSQQEKSAGISVIGCDARAILPKTLDDNELD